METTYEKRALGGKISLTAILLLLTLLTACSSAAVPTRGTAASDAANTGASSGQPYSSASSCIQSAVRAMAPSRVSSSSAAPVSPAAPAAASSVASSSAKSSQRSSVSPSTVTGKRILIGYYGSWDAYTGFTPDKINVRQINTINYAFVSVGSDYKLRLSDSATDQSNFAKLRRLKAANPGLKVVLAVGGWDDSGEFSAAAATQQARNTFAGSCADFLRSYGLDGINIDWEYPCSGGKTQGSPSDKANFTLLLQAVRGSLNTLGSSTGEHYILSIAGGGSSSYVKNVELSRLGSILDYAVIMTYDIHGPWDSFADLNAPLYEISGSPQSEWSVDDSVKCWLGAGFPSGKLLLGVPYYGYIYSGVTDRNNGLFQRFSSAASVGYDTIVSRYEGASFTRNFLSQALVPTLFNGSVFISYDDSASLAKKARYAVSKGLGGVSAWELGYDKSGVLTNSVYNSLN